MIQENNSNSNNSCYVEPSEMSFFQTLPSIVRIDDESANLMNGDYITMDIQSFDPQQQQQLCIDASLQIGQPQAFIEDMYQQHAQEQQLCCVNYGADSPTPEEAPSKDAILSDISDASTVEGFPQSEEEYAHLKGLNSDNLMQFSQQSILQEMILKQHVEGKTNLHILPIFEEHDIGNYNFQINVPTHDKKLKANWVYSEILNKLYIRMNTTFTINAVYTPKMPLQQLRIRAFICFAKEVSEPVRRCQNHLSNDNETDNTKRESLLRCENPDAEYSGSSEGKSIKERYSVSVPLNMCNMQKDKSIKQPIALQFTCQNSCIGRKETGIMFLLEGMNGEILSQRLLNVRVCSCPKRDKKHDEKVAATKRKSDEDMYETDAKVRRRESSSPEIPLIKDENSCSDYENAAKNFGVQRTANGGYRLVMELSSRENALSAIEFAYAKESVNIVKNSNDVALSKQCFKNLTKLYETCSNSC